MGFPIKFDERIDSGKLSSHVRPRSASAAIGPNGPETAAMVCAMYVRAGKGINQNGPCDGLTATGSKIQNQPLRDATGSHAVVDTLHITSLPAICHGASWFDTDSEASESSDREEDNYNHSEILTRPAESNDQMLSRPSSNVSKSPQSSRNSLTMAELAASTSDSVPLTAYACGSGVQDINKASMYCLDPIEADISSNSVSFSQQIFAPNVLSWFNAKRK